MTENKVADLKPEIMVTFTGLFVCKPEIMVTFSGPICMVNKRSWSQSVVVCHKLMLHNIKYIYSNILTSANLCV